MQVQVVRNDDAIRAICGSPTPKRWLVTTHNHRIVKVQPVEQEEQDQREELSEHRGDGPAPHINVASVPHGERVAEMLASNGQWLVTGGRGMILRLHRVEMPVVLDGSDADPEEGVRGSKASRARGATVSKVAG